MGKQLLVVGGAGALGRGIISHFKRASWNALSVDFTKNTDSSNEFLLESSKTSALTQTKQVLDHFTRNNGSVDVVVCAAGGWAGGSIKDADTLVNLGDMHAKNTESALMAAHLASHLLNPGGLLVLTGATAALKATPGMISYGISKVATHHLIASSEGSLPEYATALGVLPAVIDTPMNRKFMPDADFTSWTPVEEIAKKIHEWADMEPSSRPPYGHLFTVTTRDQHSTWADVGNPFH